jgi:hypothetical protein
MKSFVSAALLAAAANAYTLTAWSESQSESLLDGDLAVTLYATSEWYWGHRSPAQWAKYEDYHEAWSLATEFYTKFYFSTSMTAAFSDSEGVLFGMTVAPWILFWDVAFGEFLFYAW